MAMAINHQLAILLHFVFLVRLKSFLELESMSSCVEMRKGWRASWQPSWNCGDGRRSLAMPADARTLWSLCVTSKCYFFALAVPSSETQWTCGTCCRGGASGPYRGQVAGRSGACPQLYSSSIYVAGRGRGEGPVSVTYSFDPAIAELLTELWLWDGPGGPASSISPPDANSVLLSLSQFQCACLG